MIWAWVSLPHSGQLNHRLWSCNQSHTGSWTLRLGAETVIFFIYLQLNCRELWQLSLGDEMVIFCTQLQQNHCIYNSGNKIFVKEMNWCFMCIFFCLSVAHSAGRLFLVWLAGLPQPVHGVCSAFWWWRLARVMVPPVLIIEAFFRVHPRVWVYGW